MKDQNKDEWGDYSVTPPSAEDHDFHEYDVTPPAEEKSFLERMTDKIGKVAGPALDSSIDAAQYLGQKGLDTAEGVAKGASMNTLDELGGLASAGAESLYNKFNPTDSDLREKGFKIDEPGLPELYRKNQQSIQKHLEEGEARSPYLSTAGQIAGGMTTGGAVLGALGGAAAPGAASISEIAANSGKLKALGELGLRAGKTALTGIPLGALEGAAGSKEGGVLTEEERSKLGGDMASGATVGGLLGGALHGVTELAGPAIKKNISGPLSKFMENSPMLRQMGIRRQYGLEGVNPGAQSETLSTSLEKTGVSELDNIRTKELMNEIMAADKKVGQAVGQSLENATAAGSKVNIDSDTKDVLSQVISLADKYPEIAANPRARDIYGKISQSNGTVSPVEAKDLIDYMDAYIGKFKAATNKTPLEEGILSNLYTARKQFSNTLKQQVPEYGAAADRMTSFRKLVPETIIAKDIPEDVAGEYYGSMNNQKKELFNPLKKLIQGATAEGTYFKPTQESFVQTMKGMKQFEQDEAGRIASGQVKEAAFNRPISDIESMVKKYSDDSVSRGSSQAAMPTAGVAKTVTDAITGVGGTGHTVALRAAGLAGTAERAIKTNPVAKLSRDIFNAPNEAISSLAQKLKSSPNVAKYGDQLEHALQSTDTNKRNQVLFTIMQNPSARSVVDENTEPQE